MTAPDLPPPEEASTNHLEEERLQKRKASLKRCGFILASCFISVLLVPLLMGALSLVMDINFNLNLNVKPDGEPIPIEHVRQAILVIGVIVLIANAIFAIGATKMWQLKESWLLRPTALYAVMPIFTLPLLPFTLGFGIYALTILIQEDPEKLLDG